VDAGPAWVEFLDRYARLIMNTANQFEFERDQINECFIFVCGKLNDDGFRRLLKFNTCGTAKFTTWLGTVVFNLCVDWHRQEFGRVTLLPAISALPEFDQSVYHLVIEQELSKEACFQTLRANFPDLSRELVAKALMRSYSLLTPRQRWQISVRNQRNKKKLLQNQTGGFPEISPGPEIEAQVAQQLDILQEALAKLPDKQQLLLRLRFQEGLGLRKIAQLQQLGDSNRVWRHIQAAIKALAVHINEKKTFKTPK
jgi:RNA polymerase sigma factor (sigma-70 family)